jgi:hypothetical protein
MVPSGTVPSGTLASGTLPSVLFDELALFDEPQPATRTINATVAVGVEQ